MRVVATIEARMTSTRLPGKVLLPAGGEPLLAHLLRRVFAVGGVDQIVVATTTNDADDPIVACALECGAHVHRGSEDDVLGRVTAAAEERSAEVVVALTADNPLIDPAVVEQVLAAHRRSGVAITANNFEASFPDGMDVQVIAIEALRAARSMARSASDREHLTQVIRSNPGRFDRLSVTAPDELRMPELSVTVDEPDDYRLVREIIEQFGPEDPVFGCRDLILLVEKRPELLGVNGAVVRRY